MGDRDRAKWLLCPFPWGSLMRPHLTQCGLGRSRPSSVPSGISWSIQPFGHNKHGPKSWGLLRPHLGVPHLTQSRLGRGLPSYQVASSSIQPQYTNVTDRQDRTERQTGQRSDSIGRTVLQTVAQKIWLIMAALWNRRNHYILPCGFFLLYGHPA